ncbi:MAG TPA: sporulation protein YunB [Bacilli bacterium]
MQTIKPVRGWKSKPKKRIGRAKVFAVVTLLMLFFALQSFIYVERHLRVPLMNVATVRIKQMATEAINTSINERISQGTNFEELVDWKTDEKGKITGFMLNYAEHMRIAAETVKTVEETLDKLQNRPDYIPLGQAFNSAILASFGPNIPIKFVRAGAVKVDLNTRQKDAGINMLLVEVYIRIMAEVTIIIPFETQPELVSTEIPISYLLVVGDVPMYYVDNKGNPIGDSDPLPPTLSLPDAGLAKPESGATPPNQGSSGASSLTITN